MSSSLGSKTELLNVLGEVKARVQDKLGIVDFPMPQFILIGKQSVGKSRLIETFAGETFNFCSGTLGSRRPTVLEFRNVKADGSSWFIRDRQTNQWAEHPIEEVMSIVGQSHEELGQTVSSEPIYVRIESPGCVDMQIVDLPGFRDFAQSAEKQDLANAIEALVGGFMKDTRNVMLCVEQAGDAATMQTLARCRQEDPDFKRTILIRNKLDKYYKDLTGDNVNKWVDGMGDLPASLTKFAMTLPFWQDGSKAPKPFVQLREEMDQKDKSTLQGLGCTADKLNFVGFSVFTDYMEKRIEKMFVAAIGPVLENLRALKRENQDKEQTLGDEAKDTDPSGMLNVTRDCGASFAGAINDVMEGVSTKFHQKTLEDELQDFHNYHERKGSDDFVMLPSEDFCGLDDYIEYLTQEANVGAWQHALNGGAQFRRLMTEVEIFLRFSEIAVETKKRDVIQARGVSMTALTWRDVVVKLLGNEAHVPLLKRIRYVAERIRFFFTSQKELVVEFMVSLNKCPDRRFSALYPKHGLLLQQNEAMRNLVFNAMDQACQSQLSHFVQLFENMLTSTFSNPWVFLKGATTGDVSGDSTPRAALPDVEEDPRQRIPAEIQGRSMIETTLSQWLQDIPEEAHQIDEAVDKVQMLVLKTYSFIRSQVCDQVELVAEAFFKLPMLRRLHEVMRSIEISENDKSHYQARRERLDGELAKVKTNLTEVDVCIERLAQFKLKTEARGGY